MSEKSTSLKIRKELDKISSYPIPEVVAGRQKADQTGAQLIEHGNLVTPSKAPQAMASTATPGPTAPFPIDGACC
jgi:hypothetical protein